MTPAAASQTSPPEDQLDGDAEAVAALIAKLEASGQAVQMNRSGGFLVSRWGLCRHCIDLESLQAFADQLGVR